MPTLPDPLATALILLAAAGVQGFLGFGFGIVAMTALTLSQDLVHASGVVNLTGLLVTGAVFWTLRRSTLWGRALRIVPGILVGVVIGVTALRSVDVTWMVRALGATVIAISAWNLISPALRTPTSRPLDLAVGLLSGILGGAFNTGGPPLVAHLYRLPNPPEAVKATVQLLFLLMALSRLPVATSQGLIAPPVWGEAAVAAPLVLLGLGGGIALGRRTNAERFRRISWIALGALGFTLLGRS